jgi:hypothetical protein
MVRKKLAIQRRLSQLGGKEGKIAVEDESRMADRISI